MDTGKEMFDVTPTGGFTGDGPHIRRLPGQLGDE